MQLENMPLFAALAARMRWLHERQGVIASNVANADTPGYEARDLAELDFGTMLRAARDRLAPERTHPVHFADAGGAQRFRIRTTRHGASNATPTGNSVVLEEEMLKLSETGASYHLVSNLYGKHIAMLKSVLSRR